VACQIDTTIIQPAIVNSLTTNLNGNFILIAIIWRMSVMTKIVDASCFRIGFHAHCYDMFELLRNEQLNLYRLGGGSRSNERSSSSKGKKDGTHVEKCDNGKVSYPQECTTFNVPEVFGLPTGTSKSSAAHHDDMAKIPIESSVRLCPFVRSAFPRKPKRDSMSMRVLVVHCIRYVDY
jgi:hypothetical protein